MVDLAGSGYYAEPPSGPGRGVLILHSWWGLTPFFRQLADRLAELGYSALAPDMFAGRQPATPDDAEATLAAADPNEGAALVLSSAQALRARTSDPRQAIAVIGFSSGASWALWLSARSPSEVAAAVAFYGSQNIDFIESRSAYLGHFAEFDSLVSDDEIVEMEAHLHLVHREVVFHRYPGTSHWFFEEDRALSYDATAAELAWDRTVAFLADQLG